MRSPIVWYGGKQTHVKYLLPLIPPHDVYIEVFGGGAGLLFAKEPSKLEIYNDIDEGLVHFFRVLRDPELFEEFKRLTELTPYSRQEWRECKELWDKEQDPVKRAWRWFVVARQSFSGKFGRGWAHSKKKIKVHSKAWNSIIELLPEIYERARNIQIENMDFKKMLPKYDQKNAFFYLDPPYVSETRAKRSRTIYTHEMTTKDHQDLIVILLNLKGKAMLSGYDNDLYSPLKKAGWKYVQYKTTVDANIIKKAEREKRPERTETVWMNYSLPEE